MTDLTPWPQPDGDPPGTVFEQVRLARERAVHAWLSEGEQCVNKACGEDATEIIKGDAFCTVHADMVREREAYEAWELSR